jgi:hypothetical protein
MYEQGEGHTARRKQLSFYQLDGSCKKVLFYWTLFKFYLFICFLKFRNDGFTKTSRNT